MPSKEKAAKEKSANQSSGPLDALIKLKKSSEKKGDSDSKPLTDGKQPRTGAEKDSKKAVEIDEDNVVVKPLPVWKENERAGPNILMRSSLFTIGGSRLKRWVAVASQPREVICLGDYEIYQVGEELRQEDGDVLYAILHIARMNSRRGGEVQFIAADFIRELGWNRDGHTYKRLSDIIRRLASTMIIVSGKSIQKGIFREAGFSLLNYEHVQDNESGRSDGGKWSINLPSSTINLFWVGHYSRMHWDLRRNLKTTLSRYLHQLYITFSGVATFGVDQLWHLSGSQQKSKPAFRQSLSKAHDELVEQKILDWWRWTDDKKNRINVMVTPISEQHSWVNQQLNLLGMDGDDDELTDDEKGGDQ